jgi:hypothetical protein
MMLSHDAETYAGHDVGHVISFVISRLSQKRLHVPTKPVSNVTDSRIQPTLTSCAGAAKRYDALRLVLRRLAHECLANWLRGWVMVAWKYISTIRA